MSKWKSISDLRREYGQLSLSEKTTLDDPIAQFEQWFSEVLETEKSDPTAMVLSTVDAQGFPDSRVVLLKGLENGAFIFYTNYKSTKAVQISQNPLVALNFYWPQMARQVRIRGRVSPVSELESDDYFAMRPINSQLSAIVSPQSQPIENRAVIEDKLNELIAQNQQAIVVRPNYWGGYVVHPQEIEFWQGRDNRLHDRIHYLRQTKGWAHRRLAP